MFNKIVSLISDNSKKVEGKKHPPGPQSPMRNFFLGANKQNINETTGELHTWLLNKVILNEDVAFSLNLEVTLAKLSPVQDKAVNDFILKQPAGKYSYRIEGDSGKLRIKGTMTEAEKTALKAIFSSDSDSTKLDDLMIRSINNSVIRIEENVTRLRQENGHTQFDNNGTIDVETIEDLLATVTEQEQKEALKSFLVLSGGRYKVSGGFADFFNYTQGKIEMPTTKTEEEAQRVKIEAEAMKEKALNDWSQYQSTLESIKKLSDISAEIQGKRAEQIKQEKVRQLFQTEKITREQRPLNADEETILLYAYKNLGAFDHVIRLYQGSGNEEFTNSQVIQEFYIVALNKTNKKSPDYNVHSELAKDMCEKLIQDAANNNEPYQNSEVFAQLGKYYLNKAKSAKTKEEETAFRELSLKYYYDGYMSNFDYYPGINAVYRLQELGRHEEAQRLVKFVDQSTKNVGGQNSNDYWCLVTMVEVACVLAGGDKKSDKKDYEYPADINNMMLRVLNSANAVWELDTTLANLTVVAKQRRDAGKKDEKLENSIIKPLQKRMAEIQQYQTASYPKPTSSISEQTKAIEKVVYTFAGRKASKVGGNMVYGGQLHDIAITRYDLKITDIILRLLGLDKSTDLAEFNEKIDERLRRQFQTLKLEDLKSNEHKVFDDFTKNFKQLLFGKMKTADIDSKTNVWNDFFIGKGDCRHHGYIKQLSFDSWKRNNIIRLMETAYNAPEGSAEAKLAIQEIEKLNRMHQVVFDVGVHGEIAIEEMYHPIRQGKGVDSTFVKSDKINYVEDHTFSGIIEYDNEGNIANIYHADSFYQDVYKWGYNPENPSRLTPLIFEKGQIPRVTFTQHLWDPTGEKWDALQKLGIIEVSTINSIETATLKIKNQADIDKLPIADYPIFANMKPEQRTKFFDNFYKNLLTQQHVVLEVPQVATNNGEARVFVVPTWYAGPKDSSINNHAESSVRGHTTDPVVSDDEVLGLLRKPDTGDKHDSGNKNKNEGSIFEENNKFVNQVAGVQ
jgi:hypothetical protein